MAFEQTVKDFQGNESSVCTKPVEPDISQERMMGIINKIIATPDGENLIRFMIENKIPVMFEKMPIVAGYANQLLPESGEWKLVDKSQRILLNPLADDNQLISSFLHEARHAQQYVGGTFRVSEQLSPFDYAWHIRMIEADAQSESVLKAFKMKLSGDSSLFEAGQAFGYKEMFSTAEEQYLKDPTSLDDGRLKRMIFDARFMPPVKQTYDRDVAFGMYPNFNKLLELLPNHGFSKKPLAIEDIEKIGTVGGESVNYLTLPGFKPLDDLYYRGGVDNKNFLQLKALHDEWVKTPLPAQNNISKKAPATGPSM